MPLARRHSKNCFSSEASAFVRKYAQVLVDSAKKPILDVACGSGRNAFYLASLGAKVVGIDKNIDQIRLAKKEHSIEQWISDKRVDLINDPWPYKASVFGSIINVHFFSLSLFPHFSRSIVPGGYFLFESIGGQGRNYLELPTSGQLKAQLIKDYDCVVYQERPIGPKDKDHVIVRFVARRRLANA